MSEQQHKSTRKTTDDHDVADTTEVDAARAASLNDDVDSILDEIDEVLEENAEEFVRSFVQKGGQ